MTKKLLLLSLIAVLLAGCAPHANPLVNNIARNQDPAGFWLGLWHGMIAPITFVISLFNPTVSVYEVLNNGGWYNFGFLLGMGTFAGGAGSQTHRR